MPFRLLEEKRGRIGPFCEDIQPGGRLLKIPIMGFFHALEKREPMQ